MVEALRLTALRNWADAHPDAIRHEGNGKAPGATAAPPAFAMADVVTTLWTRVLRIDAADQFMAGPRPHHRRDTAGCAADARGAGTVGPRSR